MPLDVAEFDCRVSEHIVNAIAQKARSSDLGYFPGNERTKLREILQKQYQEIGINFDIANLQFVGGLLFAISEIVRLLDRSKKKIIVLGPAYPGLCNAIVSGGGVPEVVNLCCTADGVSIDVDAVEAACDGTQGAVLMTFPHVPTGSIFSKQEAIDLASLATRAGMKIVIDCIYRPLLDLSEMDFLKSIFENSNDVVLAESVTKSWAVSSIRGAWLAFSNYKTGDIFRDFSHPRVCPPTALFECVASACLTSGLDWLAEARVAIRENMLVAKKRFANVLSSDSFYCFGSTPFIWVNLRELGFPPYRSCFNALRRAKVSLDDGSGYGSEWEGFGRINVACDPDVLSEAIDRLLHYKGC
ncbi:MAG: pyridoxal phosphate-dependent aminotransferase [Magnetococcales bacterium]|nr:pyridoxal phosphate-dependent aminotransferase [Magnetococcales bacterium]